MTRGIRRLRGRLGHAAAPGRRVAGGWQRDLAGSRRVRSARDATRMVENGTIRYTVQQAERTLDLVAPLHRMTWDSIMRAFSYRIAQQAPSWNIFALIGAIVIFVLAPPSCSWQRSAG